MRRKCFFFDGVSKFLKAESKKGAKKGGNSSGRDTSLLSGGLEAWKLVPLLVHLTFSLGSDGRVLPATSAFMEARGVHSSTITNISDVISSACVTCIEMHKALDAKSMRYEDHHRVLYLISVAKYHHIRLQVLKTVCWMLRKKERTTPSVINELFKNGVKGNKHHLMFHLLLAKLELGCDLIAVDSEMSEQSHKPFVKDAFNNSSKRLSSRLKEMMQYVMKKKLIAYLKDLLTQLEGTGVAHVAPALPDQIEVEYKVDESYRLYFYTYSNVF
jgi:hypothetical protein